MAMTTKEICNALLERGINDVANRVYIVAETHSGKSLAQVQGMYSSGLISQVDYEAYCYLWRNSGYRMSSNLLGFKLG